MRDRWYWRCSPDQRYRAFPLGQPTVAAVIDGVRVLACPSVLDLATRTPVPVYRPDTGEYGVLEVSADDHFSPTTASDDRGYFEGGEQIPRAIVEEMLDWAEEYVRAHPDTPLIPRQTGNTGHHGYQTTKTIILTFNALYEQENSFREDSDPSIRRAPDRDHIAPSHRAPGTTRTQEGKRGAGTRPMAVARGAGSPSMFDGDSGGSSD